MTNAEKYYEIFGVEPDTSGCPTERCSNCPLRQCSKIAEDTGIKITEVVKAWWKSEYKKPENK